MAGIVHGEVAIDRDRLYEGLDEAHTPRLIVPEIYIERRSELLANLTGRALFLALGDSDVQFDVVWLGKKITKSLNAIVQPTGTYSSNGRFLLNPSRLEDFVNPAFKYSDRIEQALENGAGIFTPDEFARRYTERR